MVQAETGTRPDRDAPRAAIIEAGEPMSEYSLKDRGQSRLAEHQDAFRGSSIRTPSEGRCRAKSPTQWGEVEVTLSSTRSTTTAPWEYHQFETRDGACNRAGLPQFREVELDFKRSAVLTNEAAANLHQRKRVKGPTGRDSLAGL